MTDTLLGIHNPGVSRPFPSSLPQFRSEFRGGPETAFWALLSLAVRGNREFSG